MVCFDRGIHANVGGDSPTFQLKGRFIQVRLSADPVWRAFMLALREGVFDGTIPTGPSE